MELIFLILIIILLLSLYSILFSKKRSNKNIVLTKKMVLAEELIDSENKIIFITGKVGTGKSTFLRYLRDKYSYKSIALAPTGVAAINISGQTIHSFFHLPPHFIDCAEIEKKRDPRVYQKIDYLIIDEVSMLRPDIFDAIDVSLKKNRNKSTEPFGGVKIILFGDLYQLPPVVKNEEISCFRNKGYETDFFFSSKIFKENINHTQIIEFDEVFRQKDDTFINILDKIRNNYIDDEIAQILDNRLIDSDKNLPFNSMILCTTNKLADKYNKDRLERLKSNEVIYSAVIEGNYKETDYLTDEYLCLKEDAKVLFIKNDPGKRWINGTIGKVVKLKERTIIAEIDGKKVEVCPTEWTKFKYIIEDGKIKQKIVGKFIQLPLRLGWAITIHKSQGLTLDNILIDTGKKAFVSGQIYVALSRCRSLNGIYLRKSITKSDLISNKAVHQFFSFMKKRINT